jgi:septal ring factor EnvC (AmiA/AmiB activator)
MILEDQVEQQNEVVMKLEEGLNNYKQKYNQISHQVIHLEETVKNLQERLAESRSRVSFFFLI